MMSLTLFTKNKIFLDNSKTFYSLVQYYHFCNSINVSYAVINVLNTFHSEINNSSSFLIVIVALQNPFSFVLCL